MDRVFESPNLVPHLLVGHAEDVNPAVNLMLRSTSIDPLANMVSDSMFVKEMIKLLIADLTLLVSLVLIKAVRVG